MRKSLSFWTGILLCFFLLFGGGAYGISNTLSLKATQEPIRIQELHFSEVITIKMTKYEHLYNILIGLGFLSPFVGAYFAFGLEE